MRKRDGEQTDGESFEVMARRQKIRDDDGRGKTKPEQTDCDRGANGNAKATKNMEQQDERSRDADDVVKMRQGEAAIPDLAVDPF